MRNLTATKLIATLVLSALCVLPLTVKADDALRHQNGDSFTMNVDAQDRLVITDSHGAKVTEITAPLVAQKVQVGKTNFQISYGRDVSQLLTAIVAPSSTNPTSLSFTAGGSKVDMDKNSVVTLTFSPDAKSAAIDPGVLGTVLVNNHKVTQPVAMNSGVGSTTAPSIYKKTADETPAAGSASPPDNSDAQKVYKGQQVSPEELGGGDKVKPFKGFVTEQEARESRLRIPNFPLLIGGLGRGSLNRNGPQQGTGGDKYVLLKDKLPKLQQEVVVEDPGATIVPLNEFYASNADSVVVSPGGFGGGNGDEVWLQHTAFWAEPVTPPNPKLGPVISPEEIKLVEVKGPVMVTTPGSDTQPATEGMLITSGTKIETQKGGSAAVFFGGVNSARFASDSEGQIFQTLADGKRDATIDLKKGTVFSKIGRRDGETQSFKIKTPGGVAEATGTEVATNWLNNTFGVFTASGEVKVTDNNGKPVGNAVSNWKGQVGMVTIPPMPNKDAKTILNNILILAQDFNSKINALLDRRVNDQPLSPIEIAYLSNSPQVYYAVLARRSTVDLPRGTPFTSTESGGLSSPTSFLIATQPPLTTPF